MRFFGRFSRRPADVKYDLTHDEWRTLASTPFWVFTTMVVEDLLGVVEPSDDDLEVLAETVSDMTNVRNPFVHDVGNWIAGNQNEISANSSRVGWRQGLRAARSVLEKVSARDSLVFDGYLLYTAIAFADRPPPEAVPLRGKRRLRVSSIIAELGFDPDAATHALESAGWSR